MVPYYLDSCFEELKPKHYTKESKRYYFRSMTKDNQLCTISHHEKGRQQTTEKNTQLD